MAVLTKVHHGVPYRDLGPEHSAPRDKVKIDQRAARILRVERRGLAMYRRSAEAAA
jgi:hypothetical protein